MESDPVGGGLLLLLLKANNSPGLCLIQMVLRDEGRLSGKQKAALVVGGVYVIVGTFLFAQSVTQALMDDIENK
jgi:hypothetical protein